MTSQGEEFMRDVEGHINKIVDSYRTLIRRSQEIEGSDHRDLQFKTSTAQLVSNKI